MFTDIDPDAVRAAAGVGRCAAAADGTALCFPDAAFDWVVLKNIVGDPGLGETTEHAIGIALNDPDMYRRKLVTEVLGRGHAEIERVGRQLIESRRRIAARKSRILDEARRVLRATGSVLVVETLTPDVAAHALAPSSRSSRFALARRPPFDVREISGFARLRRWCEPDELAVAGLRVWRLRKQATPAGAEGHGTR